MTKSIFFLVGEQSLFGVNHKDQNHPSIVNGLSHVSLFTIFTCIYSIVVHFVSFILHRTYLYLFDLIFRSHFSDYLN